MDSVSPVLTDLEISSEQVVALGQEEYYPIVVARISFQGADGLTFQCSLTRFRFTPAERALLAAGPTSSSASPTTA